MKNRKIQRLKKTKRKLNRISTEELINRILGIQTIKSIMNELKVDKNKAVYYIYRLRKKGYVKTEYDRDKDRIYHISQENALGGISYEDILNKYSPVKISSSEVYKIYGRKVSIEEALVYAVKKRNVRWILASLALFRKINNWSELYHLGKANNLTREICALYDLSVKEVGHVKHMPKKFKNHSMPKKTDNYKYIISQLNSKDFNDIEKKWRIYIPLNRADLEDYQNDIYN